MCKRCEQNVNFTEKLIYRPQDRDIIQDLIRDYNLSVIKLRCLLLKIIRLAKSWNVPITFTQKGDMCLEE